MKINKTILFLFIKAFIILIILNLADNLYSLYNHNFNSINVFSFNLWFFIIIIGIILFKKLYIKLTLLTFILLPMLFEFLHYQYFGTYIQPISFYQLSISPEEVMLSFMDEINDMIIPFIIILLTFVVLFTSEFFIKINSYSSNKLATVIIVLSILYGLIYTNNNMHSKSGKFWHKQAKRLLPNPKRHSAINFIKSLNYFIVGILPKKLLGNNSNLFKSLEEPIVQNGEINANIIFIIGESLRAKELKLLGYPLNTTPNLEKINNLYTSSIFSAGIMTKTSVSAILNRVKYPGSTSQMLTMNNNLFYLAKKNGFKTYFYSQQNKSQLQILQNYIGLKYIDYYSPVETLEKQIKNCNQYDMKLEQALKSINLNDNNNFIVLHMRGSHSPYHKQYPKEFNKFNLAYDNTVLYTDYFLSKIIKYLKEVKNKKPTYLVFTSDHGELLHEHGRNGHGWFFPEVYEVPFIFYAINNTKKLQIDNIKSHFQVSNLISILLGYKLEIKKLNTIYVNGSDVDALAGYLKIKLDNNSNVAKIEQIK